MPTDKKVPLATTTRPPSPPRIESDAPNGLDTGHPSTDALLEGSAAQSIEQAENSAWDPRKPSRPPRTDAEATARERFLRETLKTGAQRPPAQPQDNPVDQSHPEPPSEYSHGDHGVLLSDNPDKPYILREFDWRLDGEMDSQLSQEAAERRR